MININYSINNTKYLQIYEHLRLCDKSFIPILSERVSIDKYSKKIFDHAIRFEAFSGNKLIGLIVAYKNSSLCELFITNVSIDMNFLRKKIATNLLMNLLEFSEKNKIKIIKLEVNINNKQAISFYKKYNFIPIEANYENQIFQYILK